MNVGNNLTILNAEKVFGITSREIRFIGCDEAPFTTFPALGLSNSIHTIYYPTGLKLAEDAYIAPLLHEMGHVFQLKQAGSPQKLRASLDNSLERIELGADFVAGFGAERLGLAPNTFELNQSLFGSYYHQGSDYHGRPEDRSSSFRSGYFYPDKRATLADSYADFQDNRFAQITQQ